MKRNWCTRLEKPTIAMTTTTSIEPRGTLPMPVLMPVRARNTRGAGEAAPAGTVREAMQTTTQLIPGKLHAAALAVRREEEEAAAEE
jgi:hypothetical protein